MSTSSAILLGGRSVTEPGLGDLDGLVVVPHVDEAGAEVEAQEGELRHHENEADEADSVDQAQRSGPEAHPLDGNANAGQPPAEHTVEHVKAVVAKAAQDQHGDLAEDADAGDEHVDGVAREAQEEHEVDQEAETKQSTVEAFGVDAGGDAGAEAGAEHVDGGVYVGGRDGDDQVGGL